MSKIVDKNLKKEIVLELSGIKRGRPTNRDFYEVAKKFNMKTAKVKYYWNNFLTTGKADCKTKSGNFSRKTENEINSNTRYFSKYIQNIPKKVVPTTEEFCMILLKLLLSDKTLKCILEEERTCSLGYYYSMRKKLEITGRINRKKILDPSRYSKDYNLKELFQYAKSELGKEKLKDELKVALYNNLIKVMIQYLSKNAKISIRKLKKDYENSNTIGGVILKNF